MTQTAHNNEPELNQSSKQGVQVISRSIQVLRALQETNAGMSLGDIAKVVNLPRSTVQRIVNALARESMVVTSAMGRGVQLGPALIQLGSVNHFPIIEQVRPTIIAIAQETGETVDLSLANQSNMVFIDQIPGTHRLSTVSAVGISFPYHCAANGKAVMAVMTEEELEGLKNIIELNPKTQHTITSWHKLMVEIEQIRDCGISYDREEHSIGLSAVSMAFRTADNDIVAISIPVPTMRFAQKEHTLLQVLKSHIDRLSHQLNKKK